MNDWREKLQAMNFDSKIIRKLEGWDDRYRLESITDIKHDGFKVSFQKLPEDLTELVHEIAEICPDIVYQGYGVIDEMVEGYEEMEKPLPEHYTQLIQGVDLTEEDYWVELMARDLRRTQEMSFWWD